MGLAGGLAANGQVGGQVPASVAVGSSSPITAIEASGHSYTAGLDATGNHGYVAKLGAMLGLTPTNRAVQGATLTQDQQAAAGNGWAKLLQDLPRASGTGPYLPGSSLYIVEFGLNDLGHIGGSVAALNLIKAHLRIILSRIRAAGTGVFEEQHASVVAGGVGSWVTANATNQNSGAHYFANASAGGTITITVPADFPGGTVALGFVCQQGAGLTWNFTVDAVGAGSLVIPTNAGQTGKANNVYGYVQRFTGLAPGAHTIVATMASVTSSGSFDYWQIEAPNPPLILLLNHPRIPGGYQGYTDNGFPFQPTDAQVQALNIAVAQVAAEFDSQVQVVELDAIMGYNAALFDTGSTTALLHPNDAGHSRMAAACLAAAQRSSGLWLPAFATAS